MNVTNRQILHIAVPSIVSNITIPLLGLVDVAIVGHLGSASYIGAIAVGGMLFNMIYWIFGFLRMGTGGLTAQAYGQHNEPEMIRILLRSLIFSLSLAMLLLSLQYLIRILAFTVIDAGKEVREMATSYFHICIWGAPATLGLYSFVGWFIGMQNSRYPMFIAIVQNIVNIATSLFFVFVFEMKVEGVALGTLVAQYAGLLMACMLFRHKYWPLLKYVRRYRLFERKAVARFFNVNRDIFFRTLCIVSVTVFFTSTGAAYGDVVLAVNTLLMQLFTLFSYIMDGFAYAGEALSGKYVGSGNRMEFHRTVRYLFGWGTVLATGFTLLYVVGGEGFLGLLTNEAEVIQASEEYFMWAVAIPLAGFSAFLMDGICVGATATRIMLYAIFIASACFFSIYYTLCTSLGNHALWLAFLVYLAIRGVAQALLGRKLLLHGKFPTFAGKH